MMIVTGYKLRRPDGTIEDWPYYVAQVDRVTLPSHLADTPLNKLSTFDFSGVITNLESVDAFFYKDKDGFKILKDDKGYLLKNIIKVVSGNYITAEARIFDI